MSEETTLPESFPKAAIKKLLTGYMRVLDLKLSEPLKKFATSDYSAAEYLVSMGTALSRDFPNVSSMMMDKAMSLHSKTLFELSKHIVTGCDFRYVNGQTFLSKGTCLNILTNTLESSLDSLPIDTKKPLEKQCTMIGHEKIKAGYSIAVHIRHYLTEPASGYFKEQIDVIFYERIS